MGKKNVLLLEEIVGQALDNDEEKPHEIPNNWIWARLGTISEYIQRGKSPKYSSIKLYPVISQKCIQWSGFNTEAIKFITPESIETYGEERFIQIGDILWNSTGTGTIGRLNVYNGELGNYAIAVADSHVTIVRIKKVNNKYVYYYLCSPIIQDDIENRASGTTNQIELNTSTIVNQAIPLPPLPEQKRIVDLIESLFEKLDSAKELVQGALDSFEERKSAILHKALTGELTRRWREDNGIGIDSWQLKPLSQLCNSFQYGTSKKSEKIGKVAVIRMGNLQDGEILWDNMAYTSDDEDIKKYSLRKGDILFNRTNSPELVGKTSIYRGEQPAIFAGYLIRINYTDLLNGSYLNYVMNSSLAKEYCNSVKSDGVNQSNINAKKLSEFVIPWCTIPEQNEIVRILDNMFEKEQSAKNLCKKIGNIVQQLKASILARAFRGELNTNRPSEENALYSMKGDPCK